MKKFELYPEAISDQLLLIRDLIFEVAEEDDVGEVTETLKWGEPSYLVSGGSTVRFDWKPRHPNQFSVYFNCKTTLIETFREIYGELFAYNGNREIVFNMVEPVPRNELKHCISLALQYHKVKHLPLLGA